jgi:hypothetical protein
MKIPQEVARWARRMADEIDRYEVDTLPSGEPWRVRRDPPASLPGYEHVGSLAYFDPHRRGGGIARGGPHSRECFALLGEVHEWWTINGGEERP